MKRNLRILGLALSAVFAMSAIAAGVAQAAEDYFHAHSESDEIAITAEGDPSEPSQTLTVTNPPGTTVVTVTCSNITLQGIALATETHPKVNPTSVTSEEITVGFKYEGCEDSLGGKVTVDSEGCHYLLTSDTSSGHGGAQVICNEGEPIKVTSSTGCTLTIGSQTPEGGLVYDEPSGTDDTTITAEATVSGIEYTASFICQLGGVPKSGEDADYSGKVTVEAFERTGGSATNPTHKITPLPIWHGPTS